jgi:protease-4
VSDNPWNEKESQETSASSEGEVSDATVSDIKPGSKLDKALEGAKQDTASKKEWKLIEKLLNGMFVEQRRARR